MKTKSNWLIVFGLVLVFTFALVATVSAEDSQNSEPAWQPEIQKPDLLSNIPPQGLKLKPALGARAVAGLDEVVVIVHEDRAVVSMSGTMQIGAEPKRFSLKINYQDGTYQVTRKPFTDGDNLVGEVQNSTSIPSSNTQVMSTGTTDHSVLITAITDDPLGWDMCRTTHHLSWSSTWPGVRFNGASLSTWAAHPSGAGTHWYLGSRQLFPPAIRDTSVISRAEAAYYNYDFMSETKRTNVEHFVWIKGKSAGCFSGDNLDWRVTWNHSGELWWLLDIDVLVNSRPVGGPPFEG